ncbi:SNF2-related protein [Moraxella oblonga]|uniref:SNF2-related protein n=1 Tax=Moraxella oblonga TaxID=200413 RepID=UPI000A046BB4|nr:SNF2-related protein [Moraxella oblonga]
MMKFILNSEFKKSVAKQLLLDNLAKIENDTLIIDDKDIYKLEDRQLAYLDAPDFFDGTMVVKFKPYPKPFHFELSFKDGFKQKINHFEIDGSLINYQGLTFILPKIMFELIIKNNKYQQTYDESLFWYILEIAKKNENSIELEGLPKGDEIIAVSPLHIDMTINDDGTATISPLITGIGEQKQKEYQSQILNSNDVKMLVEVKTSNSKPYRVRHIMHKKDIEAYKRLSDVGVIAKDDVTKFIQNPAPFILVDDENQEDLPIYFDSYRILGMGEPYVGYFGSKSLDSPIAKALLGSGDMQYVKEVKNKIKEICQNKSVDDIKSFKEKIEQAVIKNKGDILLAGEYFPKESFGIAKSSINTILNMAQRTPNPNKVVISIDPNDEFEVNFYHTAVKNLSQIDTNNNKKGDIYHHFKPCFEPKSYQIQGVNWLIDLYQNKFRGGILADDMGLGKTFQVIAFLNYLLNISDDFKDKRILIVAPTVLLDNWKNEFEKFLKASVYQDINIRIIRSRDLANRKQVNKSQQGIYNSFDIQKFLQLDFDILITSYETLSNYQFSFAQKDFHWGCVVYDEAHKIKNPNAQISQAARAISSEVDFSVLLTGTPIENELKDLWALFDVFDPKHFGSWKTFRKMYVDKQNEISQTEQRLRQHASNYLLRRLKKDYLKELPKKIEQVHYIPFDDNESHQYIEYLDANEMALSRLHKLKQFSLSGGLDNAIQLDKFSKTKALLNLLRDIENKKEKVIIFIIQRAVQDLIKFGIDNTFNLDVPIINGDNNSSDKVELILEKFNNINGFGVIILSPLSAGVGLTITSANNVIHYERWWNASKEDQASDRAYRIGQQKDVYIHYLISELSDNYMKRLLENDGNQKQTIDRAVHELISQKRQTAGFLIPPKNITLDEIASTVIHSSPNKLISEQLKNLSWQAFEELIKELYEKQGFECQLTAIGEEDYGADIIAKKDDTIIAIQCKHSKNGKNRNEEAIIGLINQAKVVYEADELIAVTNTYFNEHSKNMAKQHRVGLIELDDLLLLLGRFDLGV